MIGKEVRRRREELGLTGAELAARSGLTPAAVSQIETGKRTPSSASVVKLAAGLGLEVGELYPRGQSPLPFDMEGRATVTALPERGDRTDYRQMYRDAIRQLFDLARKILADVDEVMGTWEWEEFHQLPPEEQHRRIGYVERYLDIHRDVMNTLAEPHEDLEEERRELETRIAEFRKSA